MDEDLEDGREPQHLDEQEQAQAAISAPLRPRVIHEIVREEGEVELRRSAAALGWSGFAAGLSMGFSFLVLALIRSGMPDEPWRRLLDSFGYSTGFFIVILGRQQLFTESTLTAVLPVLTSRTMKALRYMLRLWGLVLVSNLLGTFVFAALILPQGLFGPQTYATLKEVAHEAVSHPFALTFLKAVFAGWLIALMVWLLPSARSTRLFVIILLTYVVSLGRLSHIIAGSTDAIFAVYTGQASVATYLTHFLLPTLLGNIVGGVALVALLNHAPVAGELQEDVGA